MDAPLQIQVKVHTSQARLETLNLFTKNIYAIEIIIAVCFGNFGVKQI